MFFEAIQNLLSFYDTNISQTKKGSGGPLKQLDLISF
jgi:hypothetical protein